MEVLIGPRGSGKTDRLITMSAERWLYIVCRNMQHADQIYDRAKKLGLDIPQPITFAEFKKGHYYHPGINGFLIDDLEAFLNYLSMLPQIVAVTVTSSRAIMLRPEEIDHE